MPPPHASPRSLTLIEAAHASPTLARLADLVRDSSERLKVVQSLIPVTLHPLIKPGPIDGTTWCLIVKGSAAAAKLRQLLPQLQAQLCSRGWEVTSIRLRVESVKK